MRRKTTAGFDDNVSSSQKLKYLRQQAHMNQVDFSDYLEIPLRTYRSWEQGTREPGGGIVNLIQRVLIAENIIPCPSPLDKVSPNIAVLKIRR